MQKSETNLIPVFRTRHSLYNPVPVLQRICDITPATAKRIVRILQNTKAEDNRCWRMMSASLFEHVSMINSEKTQWRSLEIETGHIAMPVPPCRKSTVIYTNEQTMCHRNFCTGKCSDAIMRKIGAILLPHLYAKKKEK